MKKRILALLGFTSIALAASVISFSPSTKSNFEPTYNGKIDEDHYREEIYNDPNIKPVKMQIMDYNDYTQQPTGDNMFNTQKNYHLNSLNLGNTWNNYRGDGITVAVIDTGINYNHQDFVYYNTTGTSISELSACFEDPNATGTATKKTVSSYGWSVMTDENGHGTNVASTIASRINGTGCVGVAPNVNLLFCKCPNLMSSEVSAAIRYAADNGADIITMSLGMYSTSFISPYTNEQVTYSSSAATLFSSAINDAHNKGCIIFASAGNDNTSNLSYPAANNNVIGVGALAKNSRSSKAAYSNFNKSTSTSSSNNNVDVTVVGSVYVATKTSTSSYGETAGTSFSCPATAAAMALYCQSHPGWTVTTATKALFDTCEDIGETGWDTTYGYGCVDIDELINVSYDLEDISLDKPSMSLYDNDDYATLVATSVPSYATNNKINWSTSNSSIATVSAVQTTSGQSVTITGKGEGTAVVTATSASDSSIFKTCTVEVEHYTDSSFSVDEEMSLVVGDQKQIEVTWDNPNPTYDDLTYSSSNTSVCTVSDSGLVKALKAGSSTITVESLDDIEEIAVTVSDEAPGDYNLVYNASDLAAGDRIVFVSESKNKVNGGLTSDYLSTVDVTIDKTNHKITSLPTGAVPMVLGGSTGAWTFSLGGSTLLYGAEEKLSITSGSNYSTASIAINSTNGNATIKFNNSYQLYHNDSATRFRTYKNSQGNVQIYKKDSGTGPTPSTNYTVTFNGNGGSSPTAQTVAAGTQITLPSSTRTNYTFLGWSTSSSATSATYLSGATYTVNSNVTLYAVWQSGGSSSDVIDDNYGDYYSGILESYTGTTLRNELNNLNSSKRKRTMGYDGIKTYAGVTEIDWTGKANQTGKMFGFYDNAVLSSTWDGGATWNREHVWPDSLGGNKVENDIHMARPTSVSINSGRGNKYYGTGSLYDPGQYEVNYRGVAARIIFYSAIADTSLSVIDANSGGSTSMGKLSDLLRWNLEYAPSTSADAPLTLRIEQNRNREIYRNSELQGNRNPFVDHPEYACRIWGTTNATTKEICGITDRNLSSITLSGNYKTQFEVGDSFSFGGTVTANYESGSPADVTSKATFSGYDLSTTGNQTVTVSYTENNVEKTATYQITVSAATPKPDPTGITVSPTTAFIEVGATATLTATVSPSDANQSITWSSSDSTVATVANGVVTGVKAGSATITAKTVNNLPATCTVTVTQPTTVTGSIDFTGTKTSVTDNLGNTWTGNGIAEDKQHRLENGNSITSSIIKVDTSKTVSISANIGAYGTGTKTLQCYLVNSDGQTISNVLSWSPSSTSSTNYTGSLSLTDTTDENVKIVFKTSSGTIRFFTADISYSPYVAGPQVTGITVDPTSMNLDLYGTYSKTLTATVTADDGADTTVSWESSDTSVATVSASTGNSITVTGLKVGNAIITATAGEKTATCSVSVADSTPVVHTVTISSKPTSLDVYNKKTGTITVSIDADAGADTTVLWTSSDTSVATIEAVTSGGGASVASIDASATITAVGVGTTTITASAGGKEASYDLTIADSTPHATDVSLDITSRTLVINEKVQLTETIIPSDAVEQGVTWSSNNTSVATVSTSGLVTAIAVGEATITVTTVDGGHTATCSITVKSSSQAAIDDAKAWAIYFINKTTTTDTCKASTDEQRLTGLRGVWSDLETTYVSLSNDAKTAFCTSSDTKIKEALQHYQFIISKFNKDSTQLKDFVVDGNGNKPASSSRSLLSTMFSAENSGLYVAILSIIGIAAIAGFILYRKRKTY